MGGVGGVGGVGGGVGVAAGPVAGVGAPATGAPAAASGPANSPAAVINISPQGFHTNFISEVAALDNSFKTLSDQLVTAAVLNALSDDDKKDKNESIVSALIVAAAIQAYNNVTGVGAGVSTTAVPGTGVSVSISA